MDLLAIMHAGEPYGHLTISGNPIDTATLARMVGTTPAKVRKLTAELEARNVFSRTELGVIYSRRMVRDEHIRNVRSEAGKLGGNPNLIEGNQDKQRVKPQVNQQVKQEVERKPTPAVAVAVASSSSSTTTTSTAHASFLEQLLASVPSPDAWRAEVRACVDGMAGHVLATEHQIENAARDMLGNGKAKNPSLRQFRRYVEGAVNEDKALATGTPGGKNGRQKGHGLAAAELIQRVKALAIPNPYGGYTMLPAGWPEHFSEHELRVIKAITPGRILNDENPGTLVSQTARALEDANER